jgi:hypothetical protein
LTELELLRAVEDLHTDRKLGDEDVVDLKLLKRGALLVKNPKLLRAPSRTNDDSAHCTIQSGNDSQQAQTSNDVQLEQTHNNVTTRTSRTANDAHDAQIPLNPDYAGLPEQANSESIAPKKRTPADVLLSSKEKVRTGIEHEALKREERGAISSLPKGLIVTLATCAIGAIVQ